MVLSLEGGTTVPDLLRASVLGLFLGLMVACRQPIAGGGLPMFI